MIWLFYPHGSSFRDYDTVWLAVDRGHLGSYTVQLGEIGMFGHFLYEDYAKSRLIQCDLIQTEEIIDCAIFIPGEERPVYQTAIHGAAYLFRGTLREEDLYLFTSTDTPTKLTLNP